MAFLAIAIDPADARSRRKRYAVKRHHQVEVYSPRYAAIVVDAKTGHALHQANADSLRHPASLTKIMTLYLLFEQLEAGKIKLSTPMEVSDEAASQAPTKLGLKPGQTLAVEDAIKGLVTKSANDAAVVVAEALAGSEAEFAKMMTRKARALGMSRTIYRNASGLPDEDQVTTAREQALLGMAIQDRFPRYYRYFATSSFVYRGRAMRNHNRLLGRVNGVDGIKTGYTRASGFNLVSSVRRSGRHIVAVVLGGSSGGQRDARMRHLIESNIADASLGLAKTRVVEAPEADTAPIIAKPRLAAAVSTPVSLAPPSPPPADTSAAMHGPRPGSSEPIKPVRVKTVMVKLAPSQPTPATKLDHTPQPVEPIQFAGSVPPPAAPTAAAQPAPQPSRSSGILGTLPAMMAAAGNAIVPSAQAAEPPPSPRHATRGGWAVQIGAYEDEKEAKERLSSARTKASRLLGKADPYTERTVKGAKTYYRARFAGFDRDEAMETCRALKRSDIACMPAKI